MPGIPPPIDLQDVHALDLVNKRRDTLRILTLGAIIKEWKVRTKTHGVINTVLGYPHEQSYLSDTDYHGAIVGRYCNRIANGRFSIGAQKYELLRNKGPHHLHGGPHGFSVKNWSIESKTTNGVSLSLRSEDGDQGYPGNLNVWVHYSLDDEGGLTIDWQARTDRDTVVSLTNHTYFNLSGCDDIRSHYLRISASQYTPTDEDMVPTGEMRSVTGSVLDLQQLTPLDPLLDSDDPEITSRGGLDHNWAIDQGHLCAELYCPQTQLLMQTNTTLPGLQCYTGNHLSRSGHHASHGGVCLETQYFPNSPNEPKFPSPVLNAGKTMHHQTRFLIREVDLQL